MGSSTYRWVIVAAGGLLSCVAIGAMFSLPVFLLPISQDTGWSVTGVSSAMTIGFVAMAVASMAWGTLADRIGARPVVLIGSLVLAASLALASQATSLIQFQLIFGMAVGGAIASIFAPMMACVTGWFDTHRSLAVSLVSAGMGMAPMTMSPLAAWLVSIYDWRTSLLIIAALAASLMIPAALLIRSPPALDGNNAVASDDGEPQSEMSLGQAIRSPQFLILLLTNFFCCATHSGPIFHTVSYAVSCGIPMIAAVSIYSVKAWQAWAAAWPSESLATGWVPSASSCRGSCFRRLVRLPMSSRASSARFTPWLHCSALSMPVSCRFTPSSRVRISRCE